MTTQFLEGDEVEIFVTITPPAYGGWRKAKIVDVMRHKDDPTNDRYEVQFPDGSRTVFDVKHILRVLP